MRALRVLTLNLWNDSGDVNRRMQVAIEAIHLLGPQIVGLQEVREAPERGLENQAAQIARALDAHYVFAPVAHPPEGAIGNAIVTRMPVLRHAAVRLPGPPEDPRGVLRAEIQTPAGRVIFATTHLSWELELAARRETQAVALNAILHEWPSELPAIVTGDFNATPDALVMHFLTGRASLLGHSTYWRDTFGRRRPHDDGYTWSSRNAFVPPYIERDRRIDYILIGPQRPDGRGHIVDSRVVLDVPADDGTFPSDHFGLLSEIVMTPLTEPSNAVNPASAED
jgi:endonuclease/exonuclease/phosphatase family metal-dependent hydrolase